MGQNVANLAPDSASLSPLPPVMTRGLTAVVVFSLLSLVSTAALLTVLARTLLSRWRRKAHGVQNQFIFLIFNLLLADLQQAVAFFINIEWLVRDAIDVQSPSCYAQGWFVSVGDLASGWWAVAIGLHTFACIALSHKIDSYTFYTVCASIWAFVFLAAIIGAVTYGDDLYVRAGAWCWVNAKYPGLRIWGHYFWIFVAEFGTVFLYGTLFWIIHCRIKNNHFRCPVKTAKAQRAAYMMVVYPLIYVVCTLPLASARLQSVMGIDTSIDHLCLAGAMISCTGWLDVLVYCATREVFVPTPDATGGDDEEHSVQAEDELIDTFQSSFPFWTNRQLFGTTTTIEAGAGAGFRHSLIIASNAAKNHNNRRWLVRQDSTELLTPPQPAALAVKTETTVIVRSDPMELDDIAGISYAKSRMHDNAVEKDSLSSSSKSNGIPMHDDFP
ncbi:Glucose receptor Git3 [Lasiodiplodia theobromae]|uniref:G-protein coupled receptors family 2 profile 2 domain-containing protein n=1 Tax=Lasiodiplodia theobromae TaxID=45133 RepID=A0A5N5DUM5_9PEZI|nr:Integral membrane protein [Lasiodiplodia theobromae]KAB2580652.1 hypothetical protein DBV05_g1026 [Lasiodiplodia theobromae]KAF4541390.1 Integral membrane protein [Lasiodiplodia theobromae]KAF9632646.1 Glucose receptor Git3 [Lasiodiplodia theobromae]